MANVNPWLIAVVIVAGLALYHSQCRPCQDRWGRLFGTPGG